MRDNPERTSAGTGLVRRTGWSLGLFSLTHRPAGGTVEAWRKNFLPSPYIPTDASGASIAAVKS